MPDFFWHGEVAKKVAKEAALAALTVGAEAILTESQKEVPHDTGTLQRSGTVSTLQDEGGETAIYISYNTPYARYQHEVQGLAHEPGRKWKYLEDPFKRLAKKVVDLARANIQAALRGR